MTAPQTRLYRRAWSAAARRQGWRGSAAEMRAARPECFGSPELDPILASVWRVAEGLAEDNHRALTVDDLRHACHAVAANRFCSSRKLRNADLDRVLGLFQLLGDPDNLRHVAAWLAPEAGERRRHAYVIRQAPDRYWQRIARDKFGHGDLDKMTLAQLQQLSLTLRSRLRAQPIPPSAAAPAELYPA